MRPSAAAAAASRQAAMNCSRLAHDVIGREHQHAVASGSRRAASAAATATAGPESRRAGSSTMSASMPSSRSCSATMKRKSVLVMTIGRANSAGSATRASVCWKVERSPISGTNCFGMLSRETGHSRVPAPPHISTGIREGSCAARLALRGGWNQGWRRPGDRVLHDGAQCMAERDVDLLDQRRVVARHVHRHVAALPHRLAFRAGEADHRHSARARGPAGRKDVGRAAGGRDRQQHVARLAEREYLPREKLLEAEIIADRGQDRAVGRQRDRRAARRASS